MVQNYFSSLEKLKKKKKKGMKTDVYASASMKML